MARVFRQQVLLCSTGNTATETRDGGKEAREVPAKYNGKQAETITINKRQSFPGFLFTSLENVVL